jgi:hypothetical protein
MSDFTVRVELKGRQLDGDEYVRLHDMMESEGFLRKVQALPAPPILRFKFPPPPTLPSPLPHATYFGASDRTASTLLDKLVSRIIEEIQPEIAVFVAETASYAIHPK